VQERVEREFVREVNAYIADAGLPPPIRQRLRGTRRRLKTSLQQISHKRQFGPPYYERRLLREPVPVRLRPAAGEEAQRQARAHGIPPDARIVCVHAREAGYKRGQELHETKPLSSRDDQVRNALIESYFDAIDDLVGRGYLVVRLGDPSMTPVTRAGVIDLATSPERTNLLEIHCMLRSAFVLAGESAYVGIACVTNTPLVLVNVTEPISGYPIRAPGLFLPKGVVDRRDNRRLTSADLLTLEYQRQVRDVRRYEYLSNTPDEILDITREMVEWVEGRWVESPAQRRYHEAIMAAALDLQRHSAFVRKWGLHRGFLGDGRIARVAA
jgi:putative glycosyltransferase (TIGR04372 family)